MRPERLRLAAFGAYAGEQEIDFAELGDHRLFLIHGPTGSGKTTLLDAICFALFGESSGDERDASDLRSHHAAPTRPTEVEFDFALGAEAFRIRRFPAQSLPGRGGRPVARTPEVTLWRRGSDESLSVLAETVTPVREALTELLGYTAAEFRQVVMLPQGRFRELLVAERGARKDILATLFPHRVLPPGRGGARRAGARRPGGGEGGGGNAVGPNVGSRSRDRRRSGGACRFGRARG